MRFSAALCFGLTILCASGAAGLAADLVSQRMAPPPPASLAPQPFLSEIRVGAGAHDPWSPEKGSADINAELLFRKPFQAESPTADLFIPRIHVGGSVNTGGKTSFAYAGFTWTFDLTKELFVEGALGAALHNGKYGYYISDHHSAMGCSWAFREAAAVGWRFTPNWSVMATVEHLSNAGACKQNRGLTNVGARVAYSF